MQIERRFNTTYATPDKVEVRTDDTGKVVVRGYAAKFNSWSNPMGGSQQFVERIAPGFFDKVLGSDVRALYNHNPDHLLARTSAGTLRLGVDAVGLWYEYDDPGTTLSRDLTIHMQRGDLNQSSFAFSLAENGDKWEKVEGRWTRTLLEASGLYDVSPVTYPAYEDTTVAARSMAAAEQTNPDLQRKQMEEALADLVAAEQELLSLDFKKY